MCPGKPGGRVSHQTGTDVGCRRRLLTRIALRRVESTSSVHTLHSRPILVHVRWFRNSFPGPSIVRIGGGPDQQGAVAIAEGRDHARAAQSACTRARSPAWSASSPPSSSASAPEAGLEAQGDLPARPRRGSPASRQSSPDPRRSGDGRTEGGAGTGRHGWGGWMMSSMTSSDRRFGRRDPRT